MSVLPDKTERMKQLADARGVIAAAAMDQRGSLAKAISAASGVSRDKVTPGMMAEFKTAVSRVLSPHASALLLDPELGLPAAAARAPGCGLLLAYEASGYDTTRPGRMPDLPDGLSALRLAGMGASAAKLLVYYSPFEDSSVNDAKQAFIERVGAECAAAGLPFFLELLGYDPAGGDEKGPAYAARRPEVVIRSMEEFSRPRYRADVLKVETPVNPAYVEGAAGFRGPKVHLRGQALDLFRAASDSSSRPFLYLSAGVDNDVFLDLLAMAGEAGAAFSGVLCGRATWKGGVPVYAARGLAALEDWLAREGVANIGRINLALGAARPWWERGIAKPFASD
jgi:tagatose 1,6-diphosphate aldolase